MAHTHIQAQTNLSDGTNFAKKKFISILIGVCEAEPCNKKKHAHDKHLIRFDVRFEFNGYVHVYMYVMYLNEWMNERMIVCVCVSLC